MRSTKANSRLEQLHARLLRRDLLQQASLVAAAIGASPDELVREAMMLDRRCRAAGAMTAMDRLVVVAMDTGASVGELRAELATLQDITG